MANECVQGLSLTISAAVAQYRFVKVTGTGQVIQAAAAGDDAVGISQEGRSAQDVTDGKTRIPVAMPNCKTFITAGAATAAGLPLTSDGTGRAIAVAAATDRVQGYSLSAAGAAGELMEILFIKAGDRRDA